MTDGVRGRLIQAGDHDFWDTITDRNSPIVCRSVRNLPRPPNCRHRLGRRPGLADGRRHRLLPPPESVRGGACLLQFRRGRGPPNDSLATWPTSFRRFGGEIIAPDGRGTGLVHQPVAARSAGATRAYPLRASLIRKQTTRRLWMARFGRGPMTAADQWASFTATSAKGSSSFRRQRTAGGIWTGWAANWRSMMISGTHPLYPNGGPSR